MEDNPLSTTSPRTHQFNKVKEHREKAAHCYRMAEIALTEFEKKSWLELGDDWTKLAEERTELAERTPLIDPNR
jgi:hypothetical protein